MHGLMVVCGEGELVSDPFDWSCAPRCSGRPVPVFQSDGSSFTDNETRIGQSISIGHKLPLSSEVYAGHSRKREATSLILKV